ncbi:MAG TPA: hypothetical protein VFY14_16305, partial [Streptomyces sp.]|nr:hypothetical protein [Streptomyces sp.]
ESAGAVEPEGLGAALGVRGASPAGFRVHWLRDGRSSADALCQERDQPSEAVAPSTHATAAAGTPTAAMTPIAMDIFR